MSATRRTGRSARTAAPPVARDPSRYRLLESPFEPLRVLSDDQVAAIHDAALRLLETLGMRVLLPEATEILRAAGALVDDETKIVRIGRELVESALVTSPAAAELRARNPARSVVIGGRR
ncbi:MAG: trimethylamine methyltransferase family protein, partial [Gaiella sp.]